MNEAREIRLRLLELVAPAENLTKDQVIETVLELERFVMAAGGRAEASISVTVDGSFDEAMSKAEDNIARGARAAGGKFKLA
jgi:hypothetical protein